MEPRSRNLDLDNPYRFTMTHFAGCASMMLAGLSSVGRRGGHRAGVEGLLSVALHVGNQSALQRGQRELRERRRAVKEEGTIGDK